jgi:hypothetical protein
MQSLVPIAGDGSISYSALPGASTCHCISQWWQIIEPPAEPKKLAR